MSLSQNSVIRQIAVIRDGVVIHVVGVSLPGLVSDSFIMVPKGATAKVNDVFSGGVFSTNPNQADFDLAEQKKKEFIQSIQSAADLDALKAAITAADADINKG